MERKKRKPRYPGMDEAEKQRGYRPPAEADEEPDFIAGAPNYDKFGGWPPEKVLAFLNID